MPPVKGNQPTKTEPAKPEKALKEKSKKQMEAEANRPVTYPEIDVQIYVSEPMDVETAKRLLGWTEVDKGDYTLVDEEGKKILCKNNARNRPLNEAWARTIAQDILNKHWVCNLETIIIGRHGSVLSGQHRLIGLILADQKRQSEKVMSDGRKEFKHWADLWDGPCTIQTLVAFGADESDTLTRTLDNTRPRTVADIIYTSEIFARYSNRKDREGLSKMLDWAVKLLWQRTGAYTDAYSPKRTPSEALYFIERHGRVTECVKHLFEENSGNNAVAKVFTPGPGTAAGLMYLMACGKSDGDAYRNEDHASEDQLTFNDWKKACEFWAMLVQQGKAFAPVIKMLKEVVPTLGDWIDEGTLRRAKIAVIGKAWMAFRTGEPFNDIQPMTVKDKDGFLRLVDPPFIGNIDLGDGVEPYDPADDDKETEQVSTETEKPKKAGKPAAAPKAEPAKPSAESMVTKEWNELKKGYPDKVILFQSETEVYAYNEDAREVAKHLRRPVRAVGDVSSTFFFRKDFADAAERLNGAACPFVVVERRSGKWFDVNAKQPVNAKPSSNGKTTTPTSAAKKATKA